MKQFKIPVLLTIILFKVFQSEVDYKKELNDKNEEGKNSIVFSRQKMGFVTWTLMHFYSGFAPNNPTDEEQKELKELIRLLFDKKRKVLPLSRVFKRLSSVS